MTKMDKSLKDGIYLFIYYVIFTQEYPISAQHCSPWGSCMSRPIVKQINSNDGSIPGFYNIYQ